MGKYVSAADTAKLIRKAIAESFPGVKFSVRTNTYAGGASIDVGWIDGPNAKQVEAVTGQFEGAYFDGMIDYKGSRYHALDGEAVHFGADFIFENRKHSAAGVARAIKTIKAKYPGNFKDADAVTPITVENFESGKLYNVVFFPGGTNYADSVQTVLNQMLAKQSDRITAKKSETLARVAFTGDDGYGAGTVGRNGEGGSRGYQRPGL